MKCQAAARTNIKDFEKNILGKFYLAILLYRVIYGTNELYYIFSEFVLTFKDKHFYTKAVRTHIIFMACKTQDMQTNNYNST